MHQSTSYHAVIRERIQQAPADDAATKETPLVPRVQEGNKRSKHTNNPQAESNKVKRDKNQREVHNKKSRNRKGKSEANTFETRREHAREQWQTKLQQTTTTHQREAQRMSTRRETRADNVTKHDRSL